jgi:DNA polymerase III alpha subunit
MSNLLKQNYVSLHVHSDYSFLDSVAKISDLTAKARELNMPGLALTDHGNICGWLKFHDACTNKKYGAPLKPIFGMEAYIADDASLPSRIDSRIEELEEHDKNSLGVLFDFAENPEAFEANAEEIAELEELGDDQPTAWHHRIQNMLSEAKQNNVDAEEQIKFLKKYKDSIKKSNHLIILAKNKTGYDNLIKLSSHAYTNGLFYKPRIDMKVLEEYKDGLIILSACLGGQISSQILKGNMDKAEEYVREYKRIFGEDFYLELQLHEIDEQRTANKGLIELMMKYKVQPVITQDVHYVEKEDIELHEIIIKLRNKQKDPVKGEAEVANKKDDGDSDGYFYTARGLYFKSMDELIESWQTEHSYIHEKIFNKAIANTNVILDKVESFPVRSDKPLLPTYDTGKLSAREFLIKLLKDGAKEKIVHKITTDELKSKYDARLKEELDTICELGFEQYFLIEWEMMNWCNENDVATGPGRGSAAGSLIAYLLGITHLDPIEHDLLFSRFINKSRSSAKYKLEFDDIPMAVA